MMKNTLLVLGFLTTFFVQAQSLPLEEIMKGNDFIGWPPENPRWSVDGQKVFFEWNPKKEWGSSTYFWQKGASAPTLASPEEAVFSRHTFKWNKSGTIAYYSHKGAIFSYSLKDKTTKKHYASTASIANLELGSREGVLFFEQNGNIMQFDTNAGTLFQVTNFKKGPSKPKKEEEKSFLKSQQTELFQFIRDQEAKKKWNADRAKAIKSDFPKEYAYGEGNLEAFKMNPNGKFATFRLTEEAKNKSEKMEVFITADGYNQSPDTKEKVSVKNLVQSKMGIYNVAKDTVYMIDFSKLSKINEQPEYYALYDNLKKKEKEDKLIVAQDPVYNETGTYAVVEIRSQDNKERWLVNLNLEKGTFEEIEHQHDEAWIGGPGIPSYSFSSGNLGFLYDNETLYFQSEATGFSHLYTYNLKTKKKTQWTSGKWEVRDVTLSKDKKTFYLSTNTTHPGNREFYKLNVKDTVLQPILTADGAHEVSLSPDETTLVVRYSYKDKPWELYVAPNAKNAKISPITNSTSEAFKSYNWRKPEVITFKAQDGTNVYARVYQPEAAKSNAAAVIFVHGAGYLQNAHNYWSSYHREYMFHNLLTDLGYTVLDIDYRGSDGYGRDVRTGIYRFMGGKDLSDQLDGKKLLVDKYGVDPDRVGMYGGSYGGFITLMAMLTAPKEFAAGAALRSVTDWAHYNHGYTGNILNFPETDPIAFQKSSPIYYADKLEGNLLMLHGMVDDNVEYKDIVRLSQRFIELGKKNWSLASFPVEAHGFRETYSWIDEYSRILQLFESTIGKKERK
ncbi:MAG: prolyl oligopeptidase family serine peptidase [Flavobacterium sp.]